jgi:hypothetical protein
MQSVNIRQLKTNPCTALAAARADDMVVVINRDHPQAEMLTLLSSQGIPLTGNDKAAADEVRAEMLRAQDWLIKPAK